MTKLATLCAERGVTVQSVPGAALKEPNWPATKNWRVTLSYQGRMLSVDYFGGANVPDPSAVDVLGSLLTDTFDMEIADSFEQWADEQGYNPDSRTAEAIYKACKALIPQLNELLGDDYDLFADAEPE